MINPNSNENKPLEYDEFCGIIIRFADRHKIIVFLGVPLLFDCIMFFSLVVANNGCPKMESDIWGSIVFPFGISMATYMCFFTDTGNHPAKGNENMCGCLLMIIFIPILLCSYGLYRLVRFGTDAWRVRHQNKRPDSEEDPLETQVKRLNDLLNDGLISKADYDEQLSRLIRR